MEYLAANPLKSSLWSSPRDGHYDKIEKPDLSVYDPIYKIHCFNQYSGQNVVK